MNLAVSSISLYIKYATLKTNPYKQKQKAEVLDHFDSHEKDIRNSGNYAYDQTYIMRHGFFYFSIEHFCELVNLKLWTWPWNFMQCPNPGEIQTEYLLFTCHMSVKIYTAVHTNEIIWNYH
jgi:hypothetical protein